MDNRRSIDPDELIFEASVRPSVAEALREFAVSIQLNDSVGTSVGLMTGWIGWAITYDDLYDAADAISADAEPLGAAADQIQLYRDEIDAERMDTALLIDRMSLDPQYRGNRLTATILDNTLDLFRLDAEETLIVLYPEPQRSTGGPYPDGAERDAVMVKLCAAYSDSGLEPWRDSGVWWRPF